MVEVASALLALSTSVSLGGPRKPILLPASLFYHKETSFRASQRLQDTFTSLVVLKVASSLLHIAPLWITAPSHASNFDSRAHMGMKFLVRLQENIPNVRVVSIHQYKHTNDRQCPQPLLYL